MMCTGGTLQVQRYKPATTRKLEWLCQYQAISTLKQKMLREGVSPLGRYDLATPAPPEQQSAEMKGRTTHSTRGPGPGLDRAVGCNLAGPDQVLSSTHRLQTGGAAASPLKTAHAAFSHLLQPITASYLS